MLEGVLDELGTHVVGDLPADDLLRVAVDHGREVDEALPGMDVGDVADELHSRPVGGEVPFHQIRHARGGLGIRVGGDPERARLTRHQTLTRMI